MNITSTENGHVIENRLIFGATEAAPDLINLAKIAGEDMRYEKLPYILIDYPGEYDIQGIMIHCFPGKEDKLNYLINLHGEKFAIVQSPEVLENTTDLSAATTWLYTEDTVVNKMDQLELEGEKIKLG